MATLTHGPAHTPDVHHHPAATVLLVVTFWMIAAVLAMLAHNALGGSARTEGVAVIAAILIVSFVYTRVCAPHAGFSHSLGVGIAWLLLGIAAELIITTRLGHGWYSLLGTPDRPLLRNVLLFAWIFAPALFARRGGGVRAVSATRQGSASNRSDE